MTMLSRFVSEFRSIFFIFLRLGCIAFGGPTAHLAHFHDEFVERRKWIDETQFSDLMALCQFLPGPASSQVGLSIGLLRGGRWGAIAAWSGFTLPSALLLTALSLSLLYFGAGVPNGVISGLMIAAAAVVAKALWSMWRKSCLTAPHHIFAVTAAVVTLILTSSASIFAVQSLLIILAAVAGVFIFNNQDTAPSQSRLLKGGKIPLLLFFVLLISSPALAHFFPNLWLQIFDKFYRTGAMVFGGGHVVLPLLESQTVGSNLVSEDTFLAGYGATQAVPGPLFTFSAFLGGTIKGFPGAVLALAAIYLPSFLLIFGVMPFWSRVSQWPKMRAALSGVNAAVVGLLAAAFWDPVITHAVTSLWHGVFVIAALLALTIGKTPPWLLVICCAIFGSLIL